LHRAKHRRLTGIGAFATLFRLGTRCDGRWLQLIAAPARFPVGRIGYVIGRKALPSAVARNRVRRVLREVVRRRPETAGYDVILRLKSGCERAEVAKVAAEANALLAALASGTGAPKR
jgi:ribonuclease P protein component